MLSPSTKITFYILLVYLLLNRIDCQYKNINYEDNKSLSGILGVFSSNWTYCNDTFYSSKVQSIVGYDEDNDKVIILGGVYDVNPDFAEGQPKKVEWLYENQNTSEWYDLTSLCTYAYDRINDNLTRISIFLGRYYVSSE